MKLKRVLISGVVCVSMLMTSCGGSQLSWGYRSEKFEPPIGVYIYAQIAARNEGLNALYNAHAADEIPFEMPVDLEDTLNFPLEGTTVAKFLEEKAAEFMRRYISAEKKFAELGLSLDEYKKGAAQSSAIEKWQQNGQAYDANGIAFSSILKIEENNYKQQEIFYNIYSEGGEQAVTDSELREYILDNYAKVEPLSVPRPPVPTETDAVSAEDETAAESDVAGSESDAALSEGDAVGSESDAAAEPEPNVALIQAEYYYNQIVGGADITEIIHERDLALQAEQDRINAENIAAAAAAAAENAEDDGDENTPAPPAPETPVPAAPEPAPASGAYSQIFGPNDGLISEINDVVFTAPYETPVLITATSAYFIIVRHEITEDDLDSMLADPNAKMGAVVGLKQPDFPKYMTDLADKIVLEANAPALKKYSFKRLKLR